MPLPLLPQGTLNYTEIVREDTLVRLQKVANQLNPEWDPLQNRAQSAV